MPNLKIGNIPTEEFSQRWQDLQFLEGISENVIRNWHCPLVVAHVEDVACVDIPESSKLFLIRQGLPVGLDAFHLYFEALQGPILPVSQLYENEVKNGVELPPLRYGQFYKIGDNGLSDDYCVEKYTGHVYRLTYGRDAVTNGIPDLVEGKVTWPIFYNSSVQQLAWMTLEFRRLYFQFGILQNYWHRKPKTLARILSKAMSQIDLTALYHPHGYWPVRLESIAEGMC